MWIERTKLYRQIDTALRRSRIAALLGPRQCGKTALARHFAALDLPDKARLDALHLALAVQHGMDYLVSWNFTHIVGARPRGIVQRINYRLQMETPIICTPEELIDESL